MNFFPKPYFLLGDILCVSSVGAIVGVACLALIPSDWPMFLAMFPGMLLGMMISFVLAPLVFARYFGAMEIMVPGMLGGMMAGMWVGMATTMFELSTYQAAIEGVLVGHAALFACYILNAFEKQRENPR